MSLDRDQLGNRIDEESFHRAYRKVMAALHGGDLSGARLEPRMCFYLRLVAEAGVLSSGQHLVDLGPGTSIFGPVARQLGMRVTLVDDFGGGGGVSLGENGAALALMEAFVTKFGVCVVQQDFLTRPLPLPDGDVDVVTCFHSLEHWHHSPRRLFREIARVLRPGGALVLATPNAANLRKRIFVPLGQSIGPTLREWYEEGDPVFRGHVREPVVRDLQQLLAWNGFEVIATRGRNFIGGDSLALGFLPKNLVRVVAASSDRLLRFFPALCSDIHVVGRKRA